MTYLSKKAFADSQGWAPSYVSKLASQGRLVMAPDSKKVDVEATLAKIGKTADPSKAGVAGCRAGSACWQFAADTDGCGRFSGCEGGKRMSDGSAVPCG
ncbi:Uncharacterised protein [Chromobacterium violaceum]|uniref:Uncharacterized protein n=1 Tax=Chromobacterium violaceum TaxID=536 RepID=A0A447TGW3_CHRVL|nr:Uncharacterised protein [Chromobacterium violaceum]